MITNIISNLNELKALLQRLNDSAFTQPISVFSGSTIGQHYRHLVEIYQCATLESRNSLNYNQRERNYLLESDLNFCSAQIDALILALSSLKNLDSPVTVYTDFGEFNSSFQRELLYVLEHSIHHQALIKIGLMELGLSDLVSPDFGVAPSTKKFRDQCAP